VAARDELKVFDAQRSLAELKSHRGDGAAETVCRYVRIG
jgi:hypothetical protein